jgi:protein-S-isoprenylcysteine O-methyltransferase Ste14
MMGMVGEQEVIRSPAAELIAVRHRFGELRGTTYVTTRNWAVLIVPLFVTLLVSAVSGLGYLVGRVLGIPTRLGIPFGYRLLGLLALLLGFTLLIWLFRHRPPMDILTSTYATLTATLTREADQGPAPRAEPLVIAGPYRFVRHPLYTAVILLLAGWWLVLDVTFLAFSAAFMALWFSLVVAPVEERELRALFGEQYETYARTTPRFLPSIRRHRRGGPGK